ncbi:MAG: hypothetical protein WBM75_05465 [Polyangiales bacterium]
MLLDVLGELLVGVLEAVVPPRVAASLAAFAFYLGSLASLGFGAWIAYRAITEPAERAYLVITLVAWLIAWLFWLIANKARKA